MQHKVVLSIVMPVFNHPRELREMIDSILGNTFQDWELLAVDDGSEAKTIAVLQEYSDNDSRIKFVRRTQEPKGAQTCRNIGLQMAKGEYICFFDSDDAIAQYCLEQRVAEISSHQELDFMVFRSSVYTEDPETKNEYRYVYGYNIYDDDISAFCARTLPFVVWNNIYRRSSLLKYGITWDDKLLSLQDAQFNLQTLLAGMKYAYSEKPADYMYRTGTTGSISKKIYSERHFKSNAYAIESFYKQIHNKFGKRYDRDLYRGACFVNVTVTREKFSLDFSKSIASIICHYSWLSGVKFYIQTYAVWILSIFLPYKLARRIPMLSYLMWFRKMEREWIPQRIKNILPLLLTLFALVSCAQTPVDRQDMYELSWSDEFSGTVLNDSIWSKMKRMHGARALCNLTSDDRMYEQKKGRLRLYARYNNGVLPNDTAKFLTGGITSAGKKTFMYGKIEVRAKIHGAIGTWPAVWTMPEDRKLWANPNPKYTEIDILEYVDKNDFVYQTAHNAYTLADKKNWYNPKHQNLSKISKEKYNTYSVEILPDMLIFSINEEETLRYPKTNANGKYYHYGIVSHIMLDMQVYPPKFWSSGLKPNTFPAYMDIDWIRVYKLKE